MAVGNYFLWKLKTPEDYIKFWEELNLENEPTEIELQFIQGLYISWCRARDENQKLRNTIKELKAKEKKNRSLLREVNIVKDIIEEEKNEIKHEIYEDNTSIIINGRTYVSESDYQGGF